MLVFDLLTNVIDSTGPSARKVRPSSLRTSRSSGSSRTAPTSRLLRGQVLRGTLLPGRSVEDAARLLASVDEQAHRVANAFGGFWDGIADRETAVRYGFAR